MKYSNAILFTFATTLLLTSCGNDVEEIKNPSTGKLLKRYEYYTDDSGQKVKDGEYIEWDAAGNKIAELHYQDDSLHGACVYYNEDGSIGSYNYNLGKLDGEQSLKAKNGSWVFQENYSNGKLDGIQTYYHLSGKKQCYGFFSNGIQSGKWNFFDDKGKPSFTLNFNKGVCNELTGTWVSEDDGVTTFIFGKDGSFVLKAPLFRYSKKATVQGKGIYSQTRMLVLTDTEHGNEWEYELFDIENDRLILLNPNAEVEEAILSLRRVS